MIDNATALLAIRSYLVANLSVASAVAGDVSATTTGYASAAGNFITRGFKVGMEVTPSSFTQTAPGLITALSATTMTIAGGRTAQAASGARTLAVGMPNMAFYENLAATDAGSPIENTIAGRWFFEEDYLPGPVQQVTVGPFGQMEALPQYVGKFYGIANMGPAALYAVADAVLTLFAPRTALTVGAGDSLTVRTNPAPYRGQLVQAESGWAVVPITIPLRLRSANSF